MSKSASHQLLPRLDTALSHNYSTVQCSAAQRSVLAGGNGIRVHATSPTGPKSSPNFSDIIATPDDRLRTGKWMRLCSRKRASRIWAVLSECCAAKRVPSSWLRSRRCYSPSPIQCCQWQRPPVRLESTRISTPRPTSYGALNMAPPGPIELVLEQSADRRRRQSRPGGFSLVVVPLCMSTTVLYAVGSGLCH